MYKRINTQNLFYLSVPMMHLLPQIICSVCYADTTVIQQQPTVLTTKERIFTQFYTFVVVLENNNLTATTTLQNNNSKSAQNNQCTLKIKICFYNHVRRYARIHYFNVNKCSHFNTSKMPTKWHKKRKEKKILREELIITILY